MIAAVRRRALILRARARNLTQRVDRWANLLLVRGWPRLVRAAAGAKARGARAARWTGRRLRPAGVLLLRALYLLLRGLYVVERRLLRARDALIAAATRASAALAPRRSIFAVVAASAICLIVAQFVAYRSVEVGQPGYAGLPGASPPVVGVEDAGQAHAYLLILPAVLAAVLAGVATRGGRRGLGRVVFGLGLLSVGVVLLVDLPSGLDVGAQASRFSGATATLESGFYAQLAAAGGLMLGGLLLALKPRSRRTRRWRIRARLPGMRRPQGGRRRARARRLRKRGGRPRTKPGDRLQRPA